MRKSYHIDPEINGIKKILDQKWDIHQDLDLEINFEEFRENCLSSDLIHIASHAEFREDISLLSSISLGNSLFSIADINSLDLTNKPYIFLSFCDAARFEINSPLLSLANSFLSAGAWGVIASPWPIKDEISHDIVNNIYANFHQNTHLRFNLCEAMRTLICQGYKSLDWSGYHQIY